MKAAVFYGPGDMRVEERPMPVPAENELLLKVAACAICGSDLRTFRFGAGNITDPVVIGHEVTSTVVEVGNSLGGYSPGDRLAVAPAVPCGDCPFCLRGLLTMCDNLRSIGYQFDGGFAEYMIAPWPAIKAGCIIPVPENLPLDEATLAEPLACAINGQELLNVGAGDTVAILGAGPLGCLHAMLARIRGASRVLLADIRPERLKLAASFGADALIDGSREDVQARVMEETGSAGASVVIVAAPSGEAQAQALTLAAKHGRISFFGGLPKTSPTVSLNANLIHYRELFVMGAYGSMPRHNREALELLSGRRIQSENLIGLVVPLERIAEGFDALAQGRVLKVLVRPGA